MRSKNQLDPLSHFDTAYTQWRISNFVQWGQGSSAEGARVEGIGAGTLPLPLEKGSGAVTSPEYGVFL